MNAAAIVLLGMCIGIGLSDIAGAIRSHDKAQCVKEQSK